MKLIGLDFETVRGLNNSCKRLSVLLELHLKYLLNLSRKHLKFCLGPVENFIVMILNMLKKREEHVSAQKCDLESVMVEVATVMSTC